MTAIVKPQTPLYEQDVAAWLDQQAALARGCPYRLAQVLDPGVWPEGADR